MRRKSLLTIVAAIFVIPLICSCGRPEFEKAECQFEVPSGVEVECGYLRVPEDRDREDSPMIRLHVAIIPSHNENPAPDPVVFLQGGPGGYALEWIEYWLMLSGRIRGERDAIFFDQRGVGFSEPSLNCPEAEEGWFDDWTLDIRQKELNENYNQALEACYQRLITEGRNLNAYNSEANAADVDDLRRALGYKQWNLYGSSYGTRLALTVMRDYPEGVRSVILDSAYPPQVDYFVELANNFQRALELVFEGCAADASCSERYPRLETVFYETVDQLDQTPLRLRMRRPRTGKNYEVVLNGDRMILVTREMLYHTHLIPTIPRMIYRLSEGSAAGLFDTLGMLIFFDDYWSEGMCYATECGEEAPFGSPELIDAANAAVAPRLLEAVNGLGLYLACDGWTVEAKGELENQTVVSDIPTLILAGELDPVTPPSWGQAAAEELSKSQYLEFPGFGHGVMGSGHDSGACSFQVVKDFLKEPETEVDGSCAGEFELVFVR
jgi:pimeloyl-ACP methyl ester carboxylesterase